VHRTLPHLERTTAVVQSFRDLAELRAGLLEFRSRYNQQCRMYRRECTGIGNRHRLAVLEAGTANLQRVPIAA
jgi:hypothetical protein